MTIPYFNSFALKTWFRANNRDLPWRQTRDPYAIWISEVMLQQTQVTVVIPYFLHWMAIFPTVQDLASASIEEVIKAWEGLGYYSRARCLHEGAQFIVKNFNGKIPDKQEELQTIKGLGPYTVGAILSFAFHQRVSAVDGNVLRVLTRYFGLKEDIAKSATLKKLRQLALDILPFEEPWVVNEALIELGALICKKKANCSACPLRETCISHQEGLIQQIPFTSKKVKREFLHRSVAVICSQSSYLVKKGEKGQVMSDLYEFPYFIREKEGFCFSELLEQLENSFGIELLFEKALQHVKHGFTRYQVSLYPFYFTTKEPTLVEGYEWIKRSELKRLPFSSGHRRILVELEEELI